VSSGQSPNGPRDALFGELPTTGLEVRVSYRQHVFCPDEAGTVFEPDVTLTPGRFEALDRAGDAAVGLALACSHGEVPADATGDGERPGERAPVSPER
jgi:hypothetical protein